MERCTRKTDSPVTVCYRAEKRAQLLATASAARKRPPAYLLNVCLAYRVRGLDQAAPMGSFASTATWRA